MNVEEIRIGNLILDATEKPAEVDEILRSVSCERDYGHIIKFKGLNFNNAYAEFLKPIHLTEEWLLKFGFECYSGTENFKCYNLDNHYYRIEVYEDGMIWFDDLIEIKYVHQLQNLFYALTNTELKLKEQ